MLDLLRKMTDNVFGQGEASVTVPSFDGVLKPNKILDKAEVVFQGNDPRDIVADGTDIFLADDNKLLRLTSSGSTEVIRTFNKQITALACTSNGRLAIALAGDKIQVFQKADMSAPEQSFTGHGMQGINALCFDGLDRLWATDGSLHHEPDNWVYDLMERRQTGRLLNLNISDGSIKVIASSLAYAFGVVPFKSGVLCSESWKSQLTFLSPDGHSRETVLGRLPVYPSRLAPASEGGWWLTAFIARSQLVEFVLREPAFRKRMMAELDPECWVAPRLRSGESLKEPMQGAHLKTMGVTKPWAPPRSYGLVIRLDAEARPIFSAHSRVDGHVHGIVAALEHDSYLYILARGPRQVVRLPLADLTAEALG